MITRINYGTLINYSPRGQSELSQRSRNVCGGIKHCKPAYITNITDSLRREESRPLLDILNEDRVLVPIPRSGLLKEDTIWPSLIIAEELQQKGFGRSVNTILSRHTPIIKSSNQHGADNRPSVKNQFDSLLIKEDLFLHNSITLVDDVLTMGRTSFACAQLIHEAYPNIVDIAVFAAVRTQGFKDNVETIFNPSIGIISYNQNSGKTRRHP